MNNFVKLYFMRFRYEKTFILAFIALYMLLIFCSYRRADGISNNFGNSSNIDIKNERIFGNNGKANGLKYEKVDIDLTQVSDIVAYSQIYDMFSAPGQV